MNRAAGDTIINSLRRALGASALAQAADEELLEQFAVHQDEAAFAALLRRHGPMVWGVCQRLVIHRQDAEDCFQATFLVLCRKAGSIGRSNLLANWLFGVARRAAMNARAQRARRARHEALCANLPDVPGGETNHWDDSPSVLEEELARLPHKYRAPLLLCGLEGMTHAQAGKSLGWPVGTVAGRLSRGREMLRGRLLRRGIMAPAALTAMLVVDSAPACVPPHLVAASIRSAVALFMAGQSAPVAMSATVVALARGVLRKMFLHRLLTQSILTAVAALALGGVAGTWQLQRSAAAPSPAASKSFFPATRNAWAEPSSKPAIHLPADGNAVVIRMDRSVASSTLPGTRLTVFADGRVIAEVPEGLNSFAAQDLTDFVNGHTRAGNDRRVPGIKLLEGKLTAAELEDLMRFAVHEEHFLAFDPAAVKAAIRKEYQSDGTINDNTDTTTTAFMVQTATRKHQVSWPRLNRSIWDFPRIQPLRQLRGLEQRLGHLYCVLLAGGPDRVEAAVAKMDSVLQRYYHDYPFVPHLTAADLASVNPTGCCSAVRYGFVRHDANFGFKPLFSASIIVPQQGEPFLDSIIPPQ